MVAECFIGPPAIQMLLSRSGDMVNPGRDSTLISFSNGVFFLFLCVTNTLMSKCIRAMLNAPTLLSISAPYPIFVQWQFYVAEMGMGQILLRVLYPTVFFMELIVFLITYQLLVETVVCEWKWARRWIASILISIIGLVASICLGNREKIYMYVLSTHVTALTESVVIMWLYPLGRLMDDIYFHVGTPVGTFRQWTYRIIPLFYMYKVNNLYQAAGIIRHVRRTVTKFGLPFGDESRSLNWAFWPTVAMLLMGMLYAIMKYMVLQKQNWRVLLRPRPDWGPRDHVIRQLRKQFDSRNFVESEAPRYLSRHMLAKAQTPTYRLDIKYETPSERRRSTITEMNLSSIAGGNVKRQYAAPAADEPTEWGPLSDFAEEDMA